MAGEGRIQNIKNPYITVLEQDEGDVGVPDAGTQRIFIDSADDHIKIKDETDTVRDLEDTIGGAGSDTTAIHENVSGEISAIAEKTTLHANDVFIIEDSEASNAKKRVKKSNVSTGSGGLTYNATTVTTGNVTAVEENFYDCTITGLTANRNFNLPTPTAAGKKVGLRVLDGDDTYALIIKANSVEITRVFIIGETMEFMSYGTGAGDWAINIDGRIACIGQLALSAAETTNTAGAATTPTWDTKVIDVGQMGDTANYRFNIRRAGNYRISGSFYPNSTVTDQNYVDITAQVNSTVVLETYLYGSQTTNHLTAFSPKVVACAVGDQIIYKYATQQANKGMGADPIKSWFQVEEVLIGSGGGPVPNQSELDYAQITVASSTTATTEGSATTAITGSSIMLDGSTPIIVEFFSPEIIMNATAAAQAQVILLYDGATIIGRIAVEISPAGNAMRVPGYGAIRLTPSAGPHQYIIKHYITAGTSGLIGADVGGTGKTVAAFLRVLLTKPVSSGSAIGTSELDYVEFTSNVSPNATAEASANTVVTGNAITYNGSTPIVIEFKANNARPNATDGASMTFWLYDGSSSIGQMGFMQSSGTGGSNQPIHLSRRITPSAGSHTYSIRATVSTGTGLIGAGAGGAGALSPGYIRIKKANP